MQNKIIDLTHLINEKITVYPGTPAPSLKKCNTIEKDGFAEIKMSMCSHTGTHIDAPCHILKDKKSLDQFPVSKFIGKAIVIDCHNLEDINLEYLMTHENLLAEVDFVLFNTGWHHKWAASNYFDDFPTLTVEATGWLSKFNLKGLGFDTISVDKVSAGDLPNHHILLEKEILIIENLTNLDNLPTKIFNFQCLPLKIEDADGAPVRAIAQII